VVVPAYPFGTKRHPLLVRLAADLVRHGFDDGPELELKIKFDGIYFAGLGSGSGLHKN
jgi:hypothetical protein